MGVNWQHFPRFAQALQHFRKTVRAFEMTKEFIATPQNQLPINEVLECVALFLEALDYKVEAERAVINHHFLKDYFRAS